jgi:hypothetical protein
MLKTPVHAAFLTVLLSLSSCASRAGVVVGFSAEMEEYYDIYPSIELDIAAVTDAEVNSIKSEGVGNYFSPGSSIRTNLAPFTIFFSEEHTAPVVLWFHDEVWKIWRKKDPANLAIMVSLPQDSSAPPSDPRILIIPIKKRYLSPVFYVEVYPKMVNQVHQRPADPKPQKASVATPTKPPAKSIEQDLIAEGIFYAF